MWDAIDLSPFLMIMPDKYGCDERQLAYYVIGNLSYELLGNFGYAADIFELYFAQDMDQRGIYE
jgi:hypothetical protein